MAVLVKTLRIEIDGKTYDDYDFSDIHLVQELQQPNALSFQMQKFSPIEDEKEIRSSLSEEFLGKKITYSLSTIRYNEDRKQEDEDDKLIFSGIIFDINIVRTDLKACLVIEVIAYSPDYLLFDNPHCFSFEKQTLTDIVSKILEPYDITINNDPRMTEEIPYTVQYNETNYAFLSRLASRFGEWLYYKDEQLVFGKIDKLDTLNLHLGLDVLNYRYSLDIEHLNFTHFHHNYLNYGNTQKRGHDVSSTTLHTLTDTAYDHSKDLYAKETYQHLKCSDPEDGFDEVEISAPVQAMGKKAQMMICHGSSNRADLKIGSVIKIKEHYETDDGNPATCYHDELLICKITHSTDQMGNYENTFMAIPASCEYPPYTYDECYPKTDPQRAVVMDNKDPESLGRIRVQFLWQKEQDDGLMTPWIRIAQPYGGDTKGCYWIPEIDEEVMVGFENGNAEKPFVMGTLFHGQQKPDSNWYNDDNNIKAIRTRSGHTVEINDVDDGGFIKIYDYNKENYILTFSTDDKLIKLESTGNIELYAKEDIILKADNDIVLKADNDIYREAKNDFNDLAHNDINLQAENDMNTTVDNNFAMEVQSNYECTVKGDQSFDVTGNQTMDVKGKKEETITQDYKLGAMNVEAEAKLQMKLSSAIHEQKSKATMTVDGGLSLALKGVAVAIN